MILKTQKCLFGFNPLTQNLIDHVQNLVKDSQIHTPDKSNSVPAKEKQLGTADHLRLQLIIFNNTKAPPVDKRNYTNLQPRTK